MNKLKLFSNITLGIGSVFAVYYLIKAIPLMANGMCPLPSFKIYVIIAILFFVVSIILDTIKAKILKNEQASKKEEE